VIIVTPHLVTPVAGEALALPTDRVRRDLQARRRHRILDRHHHGARAQAHRVAVQDGAGVDFLHVWREPWLNLPYARAPFGASAPMTPPAICGDYLQATESSLRDFVSEASQDIESRALLVQANNYGNGIVAHARQTEADLIVMGRKGPTNLRYVLLGSTAEQLLTISPTALLVVNPGLTACLVVEAMQPGSMLPF
jgi:nucleotide-binding universal stress UspA family protein